MRAKQVAVYAPTTNQERYLAAILDELKGMRLELSERDRQYLDRLAALRQEITMALAVPGKPRKPAAKTPDETGH